MYDLKIYLFIGKIEIVTKTKNSVDLHLYVNNFKVKQAFEILSSVFDM